MLLIIKIPKEFEKHYKIDKFEDSLKRVKSDVSLLFTLDNYASGRYEIETINMLITAFKDSIVVNNYLTIKLIKELSYMDAVIVGTAYHYARNLVNYGVDVTKQWKTSIENSEALEKAYNKGYLDALKNKHEREVNHESIRNN